MHGMMIDSYEGMDTPYFTIYGIKVPDAPEDTFDAKVKLKIVRQETPVKGKPSVEFAIMDIEADGVEFEKAEAEPEDGGDALEKDLEVAVMKKSGSYPEGDED